MGETWLILLAGIVAFVILHRFENYRLRAARAKTGAGE